MSGKYTLCTAEGRQDFFDQIEADIEELKGTLSTRQFQNVRVSLKIGYDIKGLTKAGKKKAHIGERNFRTLDKLERFLGLKTFRNGQISGGGGGFTNVLDWSKNGLCKYKKKASVAIFKMRGENIIGETILKKYKLE